MDPGAQALKVAPLRGSLVSVLAGFLSRCWDRYAAGWGHGRGTMGNLPSRPVGLYWAHLYLHANCLHLGGHAAGGTASVTC